LKKENAPKSISDEGMPEVNVSACVQDERAEQTAKPRLNNGKRTYSAGFVHAGHILANLKSWEISSYHVD
jgi:hypothetical protein